MQLRAVLQFRKLKFRPLALLFVATLAGGGCSSSGSKDNTTPPSLVFEGFETANGDKFKPGELIHVPCDRRLTVMLGPSEDSPYLLDNWDLQPPGTCTEERTQCGTIRLRLVYTDGREVDVERASLAIVLESELVQPDLESLKAQLINASDGKVFSVDGTPVSATAELSIRLDKCSDPSMGGAGGEDNNPGLGGEPEGPGGMGGASAEGGAQP